MLNISERQNPALSSLRAESWKVCSPPGFTRLARANVRFRSLKSRTASENAGNHRGTLQCHPRVDVVHGVC